MNFLRKPIKALLKSFNLKISKDIHESEVSIDVLCGFLRKLEPQEVVRLVRVGSENDGGYVIPANLGQSSKLFSPGCDGMVHFERDLYRKFKIPSVVLDHISKKPSDLEAFIEFQDNWLDASTSENTISLRDWVSANSEPNQTCILQMDIEGSEYEVLRNTPEYIIQKFHTIIVEFHYFEMIKNSFLFESKIQPVFDLLLQHHIPIFVNPNNCCGVVRFGNYSFPRVFEITFLNRNEVKETPEQNVSNFEPFTNVKNLPPISIKWEEFRNV